jgi:hypothetical protein
LAEGEKAHPANYQGCRHAKQEMAEEEITENTQDYNGMFSSNLTIPGMSAAALRGSTEQHQRPQASQVPVAGPAAAEKPSVPASV